MSIIRPSDLMKRKKELIDQIIKDLSPGLRDQARRFLEKQGLEILSDRKKVLELLKKKGLII